MMRSAITVLLALPLLASCAGANFDKKSQQLTCPDVPEYTCEQQRQAAKELEKGVTPMLHDMTSDYSVMRDQSRNCAGKPPAKAKCEGA